MNKAVKTYLVLLVIVIGILIFLQLNKSTIIDWRKTFDINEKTPFGLYIFNQEIEGLLGNDVIKITESPYDFYSEDSLQEKHNILLINQDLTKESYDKLLARVALGDNLMIITEQYSYSLTDTLNYRTDYAFLENNLLQLVDEKYKADSIYINKLPSNYYIESIDTLTTQILGFGLKPHVYDDVERMRVANFIVSKFGEGKIYIHTEPLFLTNYYLLNKDDYKYAEDVFSYLPPYKTYWFVDSNEIVSSSPLRFILKTPALRYAWYTILVGVLLFIIFNAKRRQRMVPVIEPHKNLSAEFVKTIGNLYLQEGNYKDMAHKKATYFLNKLRTDLLIDTHKLDDNFWRIVQLKTGAKDKDIKEVIPLLEKALHAQAPIQESELIRLNQLLNAIYN